MQHYRKTSRKSLLLEQENKQKAKAAEENFEKVRLKVGKLIERKKVGLSDTRDQFWAGKREDY